MTDSKVKIFKEFNKITQKFQNGPDHNEKYNFFKQLTEKLLKII